MFSNLVERIETMLDPLKSLSLQVWEKIPSILIALLLLLLGSFVGRWLRFVVERLFTLAKFDEHSEKVGLNKILYRLGMGNSPTTIVGFLIYWLVFLAFVLSAADVVNLNVVSEFLQKIILFMPKLIAAILIIGGGLFLGHFISDIVLNAAQANEIKGAVGLSKFTFLILVVFSSIMALEHLGFETSVLSRSVEIILGSIGAGLALAFGLAFGLAGKEAAANLIQDFLDRTKNK